MRVRWQGVASLVVPALLACSKAERSSHGQGSGGDSALDQARAVRDEVCACKTRPCFAEKVKLWDAFADRHPRALAGMSDSEQRTAYALVHDVMEGCERELNRVALPPLAIVNECYLDPQADKEGTALLHFYALVPGEYRSADETTIKKTTIYSVSCRTDRVCEGQTIDIVQEDGGPAEITFMGTNTIGGARLTTIENGIAVVTWGVHTFVVDGHQGTIEHRDTSGGGKTTCAVTLIDRSTWKRP